MIEVEVLVYLSFFFPSLFPSLMSCLVMGSASDFCLFSFLFFHFEREKSTNDTGKRWRMVHDFLFFFFFFSFFLVFLPWIHMVDWNGTFLTITSSAGRDGMGNACTLVCLRSSVFFVY